MDQEKLVGLKSHIRCRSCPAAANPSIAPTATGAAPAPAEEAQTKMTRTQIGSDKLAAQRPAKMLPKAKNASDSMPTS
jgi:hypothetical protein